MIYVFLKFAFEGVIQSMFTITRLQQACYSISGGLMSISP